MSSVFPSFRIEDGKPILWKGKSLSGAGLKDVLFAARAARHFTKDDTIETARERWNQAAHLLRAILEKLPSMEDLQLAIPAIPLAPTPPEAFLQEEPRPESHRCAWIDFAAHLNFWKARMRGYQLGLEVYHEKLKTYQDNMPDYQRGVEIWNKLGGESRIYGLRRIRLKLTDALQELERNLVNPYGALLELSFEILPPGLWNSGVLVPYLGGQGWDEKKIVPERLDHLISLNPLMVFKGNVYRGYNDYLLFLFEKGGPAVLETPIHGNATYILHREWLALCQRSKHELIKNPDVTRIIHHNMTDWRYDVCRALKVKPPSNSNDY
jgi:hypothetical protein